MKTVYIYVFPKFKKSIGHDFLYEDESKIKSYAMDFRIFLDCFRRDARTLKDKILYYLQLVVKRKPINLDDPMDANKILTIVKEGFEMNTKDNFCIDNLRGFWRIREIIDIEAPLITYVTINEQYEPILNLYRAQAKEMIFKYFENKRTNLDRESIDKIESNLETFLIEIGTPLALKIDIPSNFLDPPLELGGNNDSKGLIGLVGGVLGLLFLGSMWKSKKQS